MQGKTYPVLDKYTYAKPHQTDYSYKENDFTETENRIQPRLMYRRGSDLLPGATPFTVCDFAIPKNSFAVREFEEPITDLAGCTGFAVEYTCACPEPVEAVLRISLFSGAENCAGFMSVCSLQPGRHTVLFETSALTFAENIASLRVQVVSLRNTMQLGVHITAMYAMHALDPMCRLAGQTAFFNTENGTLTQGEQGLHFAFEPGAALISPQFPDSSDTVCNMLMPRRNTIFLALANHSPLTRLTVAYRTTTHADWCEKIVEIRPYSDMTAYYCNLSDTPNCDGRLVQFALHMEDAAGSITLRRYTFEEEHPIEQHAGRVLRCAAAGESMTVTGTLLPDWAARQGAALLLYQTDPSDGDDTPDGKELIGTYPVSPQFSFALPLRHRGLTRFSAQFVLLLRLEDGSLIKVDDRFAIDNTVEAIENEYDFDLPPLTVSCTDFGAKGDAVTDDTAAIQAAIDFVSAAGGGKVIVPGDDSFYGRRYVITNLLMRSFTQLHLQKGAVLWQSQDPADYCYRPFYGHDGVIEGINWTHSMHICNLPIIHAHNCEYVKVTGKGKIRSMDTGSEEALDMPGYSCGCPDRIHQISIGFFNVEHVSLQDLEIVRANNYHITLYRCSYLSVIGLRMHQVKCVSGDGVGLGKGSHHGLMAGVLFQSNDDAITLTSSYHDPRGVLWWSSAHDGVCGPHHIAIRSCYLNSGGGKAIAFLPWGTTQSYAEKAQVHHIDVTDCHLTCVSPVGAWADNPYKGKMPFDNAETDDWSPVMSVRIYGNRYQGNCGVYPLQMTDVITDCGIHSAEQFLNGDFSLGGFANWNVSGAVEKRRRDRREYGCILHGSLCQGLYLQPGTHTLTADLSAEGDAQLFARSVESDALTPQYCTVTGKGQFSLTFTVTQAAMWYLGVQAQQTTHLYSCTLHSRVDRDALHIAQKAAFRADIERKFVWNDAADIKLNTTDGKLFLTGDAPVGSTWLLPGKAELDDFEIQADIRVLAWHRDAGQNSYGFLLRQQPDGSAYRFCFLESLHRLVISHIAADESDEILYCRENFFFTSDDFHSFRIQVKEDAITFWVDNAKYATVRDGRLKRGRACIFARDLQYLLRRIDLQPLS